MVVSLLMTIEDLPDVEMLIENDVINYYLVYPDNRRQLIAFAPVGTDIENLSKLLLAGLFWNAPRPGQKLEKQK